MNKLEGGWKILEPWQGPARRNAIVVSQNIGDYDYLFIMGGENLVKDGAGKINIESLNDCYRYTLRNMQWERIANSPYPIAAAPAINYGQSHILVFGESIKPSGEGNAIGEDRDQGRSPHLLVYHTITNNWIEEGEIPLGVVRAEAVNWKSGIVLAGGETGLGRSTPKVQHMTHDMGANASFGLINYSFLIIYMVALIYMGIYFF